MLLAVVAFSAPLAAPSNNRRLGHEMLFMPATLLELEGKGEPEVVVFPFKTPEIRFYKLYLLIQSPEAPFSFVAAHLVGDRLCPLFAGFASCRNLLKAKVLRQLFHSVLHLLQISCQKTA